MFRIGQARDIHRLEENGRDFILGGVKIPHNLGPVSHSDGDCLYKKDIKKIFTKYLDRATDVMHTRIKNEGV